MIYGEKIDLIKFHDVLLRFVLRYDNYVYMVFISICVMSIREHVNPSHRGCKKLCAKPTPQGL
jgi:hypothetical protein